MERKKAEQNVSDGKSVNIYIDKAEGNTSLQLPVRTIPAAANVGLRLGADAGATVQKSFRSTKQQRGSLFDLFPITVMPGSAQEANERLDEEEGMTDLE